MVRIAPLKADTVGPPFLFILSFDDLSFVLYFFRFTIVTINTVLLSQAGTPGALLGTYG